MIIFRKFYPSFFFSISAVRLSCETDRGNSLFAAVSLDAIFSVDDECNLFSRRRWRALEFDP